MDSPQNHIWGPALWMILHSSAEKIGTKPLPHLPQEESRIWIGLLNSLRYSLPCPHCKKHFTEYLSSHPIHSFTKDIIRTWLFDLHSQINQRTDKNYPISILYLPELYNNVSHFMKYMNIVMVQMKKSIQMGWSTRNDIQRTLRFLEELRRFYDLS